MTKIYFSRRGEHLIGFKISGHTGKAEEGKDILCAAISTAAQMAVVGISEVAKLEAKVEIRNGFLSLEVEKPEPESDLILQTLFETLKSISENEKKYVKLEVKNAD